MAARAGEQHRQGQADAAGVERGLLRRAAAPGAPAAAGPSRPPAPATGAPAAGVPGRGEYLKLNAWAKPTSRTRASVASKVGLGLAGMADDEVGRQREVRPRRAQPFDQAQVVGRGVPAVHRRQHAVGARLHRQVQERHQHRQVAMRGDQFVVHVARVRRGVAQAQQAGQRRQLAQQPPEAPGAAVRAPRHARH